MADIFISYKHEEQQIAKKLADALQKKGWTVWWDPEVLTGERFHDIIDTELKESKCVVVLWSKLSVESENVKDEATYALKRKKLVPITIEDVDLPYWAERINTGQLINWDGSDNFPGYQKLVSDITKIIAEEDKRRRKEAERKAENERRRKQEQDRKLRKEEQRKAKEERQRLEEEKQRLAEQKSKFEEEQKRFEAARKAEEERKQKEAESKRKADEEKRRKEKEELKLKTEEERKPREIKTEIKPDKPELAKIKPSEPKRVSVVATKSGPSESVSPKPRKTNKALKVGVLAGVAVLLIAGIWWWVSNQQAREVGKEMANIVSEVNNLEKAVAEIDEPEQIEKLYRQRDTLNNQVSAFSEQATKVGLESQLEQLQDRLKQIQIQLADKQKGFKDKEFIEVQQEIKKLNNQALNLEKAISKLNKPEQIKEFARQRDTLSLQAEGFSERATKAGLESQLDQLQKRLKQIQDQLANREKEFIEVRQEIVKLNNWALNLEKAVSKLDKPERIEEFFRQRDTLSRQAEALSEQATKVGLESQLEQLQNRLKQVQIQLANKEKELIAARKGKILVAAAPDNATVKVLNIDEPFQQRMELEPGKYHVQVSSEGYEPQDRWIELSPGEEKQINFELEKIIQKVARLFVETIPESATVRILNIKPKFSQGMELKPGSYHVEVAAAGYEIERRWIDLVAGYEEPIRFELAKIAQPVKVKPSEPKPVSVEQKMLILTGKWYDIDQHDSFILIEKYGNSLQIKIRRGGQSYYSPLSVAEKIKWNGTKLEFIERRSGYDVFYELTLKDNTTLVGTRRAEGTSHTFKFTYEKVKIKEEKVVQKVSILTGKWYDIDQHDSFILIEKYGNSLQIKIRRGGQSYYSPLSVAEKIKWNGTKLEFIERRSGYDVFYELTLKDNTTLVGTRRAEGTDLTIKLTYEKVKSSP